MNGLTRLQERFEASDIGRMVLSAFLIFTLLAIAVWNLPGGVLQKRLLPVARPYLETTGLDQGWGVFAPNPRRLTNDFFARLDYADGTETIWRYPTGTPFISYYRTYRWEKWGEHVSVDIRSVMLAPAAQWLRRTQLHRGDHPIEVTLVQRWADTRPPGDNRPLDWQQQVLYTWTSPSIPRFGI